MIGRAQESPAQFAAGDVRKISFDRLGLGDVDFVKIVLGKTEGVALKKLAVDRESAVFAQFGW